MSINPHDFEGAELEGQLEQAIQSVSADDLAAMAAAPPPTQHAPTERGTVRGTIIGVRGGDVFVDIGGKSEAFISIDEFDHEHPPMPGQSLVFVMHGLDHASGLMRLSLREVRTDGDLSSLKPGDVVEARVTGVNIGGLELNIRGLRAFMPKSQVDLVRVEDFTPFIGRRLDCEVSEIDRKGKTVVLSRRRYLERQREQAREALASQLAEGQVRKGVVRRLTDFGAFVDIGGIEGLLHVSDIRWGRVGKPSDVLKVGDEIDVQILKLDLEKKRISLGAKQLQADPWELAAANYRPGTQVNGKVVRLADFGAFVELEPGVEALLPISEISWTHRIRHPKDVLNEGDAVRVVVIAADPEKRKLTLSLKQLAGDPWKDIEQRYAHDAVVSGRVSRVADFGAFVELEEGVEGLVHISELSDRRVKTVGEVVKPGDVVKVRVKAVDTEQRRISLSMKSAVEKAPAEHVEGHAPAAAPQSQAPARAKRKKPLRGGLD